VSHDTITRYWQETDEDYVTPCYDVVEWANWLSGHDAVVAVTRLDSPDPDTSDHALVSTVFVGTQPDALARPPRVYETMTFVGHTAVSRKLSSSRHDALLVHDEQVDRVTRLQ